MKMSDLLLNHLGHEDTAKGNQKHHITNISEWLQGFAVYVLVIAKKEPQ